MLIHPLDGTLGFIKSYPSVNVKFIEYPQFFNSLVFMLFFMFLYCISIMVIVFQMKSLMDNRLLNLSASEEHSLFSSNSTFHNNNNTNK